MALLQEIPVPLLAVNDTTLTVVEISFPNGARVKKGDNIMVFETSKTTYDVAAPEDGFIQYLCEADHDYEVNEVVARIYSEEAEAQSAPAARPAPSPDQPGNIGQPVANGQPVAILPDLPFNGHGIAHWDGETIFSREADRLIAAAGLNKAAFKGKDFVSAADVHYFLQPSPAGTAASPAATPKTPKPSPAAAVDPAKVILERLSSAKKREIEYLSEVQSTGLTSTMNTFVDVEGIFTHLNPALKYLKDSLLPVIVYESSRLLADYPLLNAWFNGDSVALYREVNPGFAIDIDKGLKVLKIARAGEKSIGEIERDILRLSGSYLDDTLPLEELTDITFTITDLSAEGVAFFRPLVNKMNSSILGVSAIDDKMQRCILSLTFDHRVTEGKSAARFLKDLKGRLESYRPADFSPHRDIACFKCYKTLKEDLGGAGFVRCITPEGKDGYICQTCLKGF
ncbi:MAG TPA: 2-oxo acid dehydrogenase subunit E2 [Puia sp.]|jgi:pyruvate/2-oxoglutarate dehydrogenase complex dihydrolipoamide acyltransferase (E2) component|nr:2-oxo acid dehydrogenase subunit E2 [Puia sp.]